MRGMKFVPCGVHNKNKNRWGWNGTCHACFRASLDYASTKKLRKLFPKIFAEE